MKKNKSMNRQSILDTATRIFERPMDARPDYSKMIAIDDNDFYIENYKKIIKYTAHEICFLTSYDIITFIGEDMYLRSFSSDALIISGKVGTITYERREGND